jgi:hypothetical protein
MYSMVGSIPHTPVIKQRLLSNGTLIKIASRCWAWQIRDHCGEAEDAKKGHSPGVSVPCSVRLAFMVERGGGISSSHQWAMS